MKKSRSAIYYSKNPAARAKKAKYDTAFNSRPSQVNKREELNKYNYRHGKYGNGDGLDASHKGKKIVGYSKASNNRGDKNNSRGDRNARGGKMRFGRRKS